jgi:hypothetical protein
MLRHVLLAMAVIGAAFLMRSKARGKSNLSYIERSFIGMSGEMALHSLMRLADISVRTTLPSLQTAPVDHIITLPNVERRVQTKTATLAPATHFVPPDFKLVMDASRQSADWYCWCILGKGAFDQLEAYVTIELIAFAPLDLLLRTSRSSKSFGRYVILRDVPTSGCEWLAQALSAQPLQRLITRESYERLISNNSDDWIVEALDLADSPDEAYRVLRSIVDHKGLRKTIEAIRRSAVDGGLFGTAISLSTQMPAVSKTLPTLHEYGT